MVHCLFVDLRDKDVVTVVDLRATSDFEQYVTLTYADGTFWLRQLEYRAVAVNATHIGCDIDRPLFEGDSIRFAWGMPELVLRLG